MSFGVGVREDQTPWSGVGDIRSEAMFMSGERA